jgi:hypothetical protein
MTVRSTHRAIALSVATVLLAWPAVGQINPFRGGGGSGPDLTKEDLALMEEAGAKLRSPAASVGATEDWHDDATGNHGTVSLLDIRQDGGLPCRKIRHDFVIAKKADRSSYVYDVCQLPTGEWKMKF